MSIYQYHPWRDGDTTLITVSHACGHDMTYSYGGTAERFAGPRRVFGGREALRPCPDCRTLAALPDHAIAASLPVISATAGAGRLEGREGKTVLVLDHPVIVEDAGCTYATRILSPSGVTGASYLHRQPDHAYTAAELAWIHEYVVIATITPYPAAASYYGMGASLKTAEQLRDAEARLGRKIALTRPVRDHEGDRRDQRRIEREEAALELAVEDGQIPGAMPSDI